MRPETVYDKVASLKRRLGGSVPAGWTPHSFRHTHASALTPGCHCGTCRRPPRTPTRAPPCATTAHGPAWTGTPPTSPGQRDSSRSLNNRRQPGRHRWPGWPRPRTQPTRSPDVASGSDREPPLCVAGRYREMAVKTAQNRAFRAVAKVSKLGMRAPGLEALGCGVPDLPGVLDAIWAFLRIRPPGFMKSRRHHRQNWLNWQGCVLVNSRPLR